MINEIFTQYNKQGGTIVYRLGINLGLTVNRYIEPEVWTKIVAEDLGLGYVQFVADLLDPFYRKNM